MWDKAWAGKVENMSISPSTDTLVPREVSVGNTILAPASWWEGAEGEAKEGGEERRGVEVGGFSQIPSGLPLTILQIQSTQGSKKVPFKP